MRLKAAGAGSRRRAILARLIALLLTFELVCAQPAGASAPFTVKELAEYRLGLAMFQRFDRASRLIASATAADRRLAGDPLFTRDVSVLGDVVEVATALEARLAREPAFAAALGAAGLSAHEYTRFALALMAARLAHGFVRSGAMRFVPPGVATDNVAFVEAHQAEIAAVLQALGVEEP